MDNWDGRAYFFLTENLVLHNDFRLYYNSPSIEETGFDYYIWSFFNWQYGLRNPGQSLPVEPQEPIFTSASPLQSYLAVPFYVTAKLLNFSPVTLTSLFFNSIILSLTCTVIFSFSLKLYNSRKIAFVLALTAGVCSFAWPYVDTFLQQPLTGLMIISSIYFLYLATKNKSAIYPILSGLFTGLIVFAHSGTVIVVPGIIAVSVYLLLKEKKKIAYYFSGLIPIAALQMYFNWFRFGSVTDFGYGHLQGLENYNSFDGIIGMIFSPGFGLIVNLPLFVLFPVALYYLWKKNKPLTVLFGYIFVSAWIFFGLQSSPIWHGMGAWGPRYMVPIIPIMVIPLGLLIQNFSHKISFKILFTGLAVLGFYVNLLGVLVWYQIGFRYSYEDIEKNALPLSKYFYLEWIPQYLPVVSFWNVLTSDFAYSVTENPVVYWNWCIPDIFLLCNFGIIPVLLIILAIASVFVVLIKNIFQTQSLTNTRNDLNDF